MNADLRAALAAAKAAGRPVALGTLVRRAGSTYRRAGARMLIDEAGETVGLVSGGCLEPQIAEAAREVLVGGVARLLRFDMTGANDGLVGYGLGCKGVLEILLERLETRAATLASLELKAGLNASDAAQVVAAVFHAHCGAGAGAGAAARLGSWTPLDGAVPADWEAVAKEAAAVLKDGRSATKSLYLADGLAECWFDVLPPAPRLIVCGGGPDARPLVRFASEMGWRVTVLDHRPVRARAELFPEAERVTLIVPEEVAAEIPRGAHVAVVVMTHSYQVDLRILPRILPLDVAYLGLLGPQRRGLQLLDDIRDEFVPTAAQRERLHSPVGLRLGGDTPASIALAIAAEIQTVLTGAAAGAAPLGSLRTMTGPIHDESA